MNKEEIEAVKAMREGIPAITRDELRDALMVQMAGSLAAIATALEEQNRLTKERAMAPAEPVVTT